MYSWPTAARFPSIRHKYERQAGISPLVRRHATLIWHPVQVRITDLAAKSRLGITILAAWLTARPHAVEMDRIGGTVRVLLALHITQRQALDRRNLEAVPRLIRCD
jgi:hypothetical protein